MKNEEGERELGILDFGRGGVVFFVFLKGEVWATCRPDGKLRRAAALQRSV
jgi:hypothetical protein